MRPGQKGLASGSSLILKGSGNGEPRREAVAIGTDGFGKVKGHPVIA